ncbi:MAG: TfoX/Sxy family protein [Thermodesulfobacteriota bacterium]
MAYDEKLAERLSNLVKNRKGFSQKKMFGGVAFLLNGNMCFGVHKDELVLRMDEESALKALKRKHTKLFDITGRPMKGWIMVSKDGIKTKQSLSSWAELAIKFVRTLPKK